MFYSSPGEKKKIEKKNILGGLTLQGTNHHFLSHLVPDVMRQRLRPLQPIRLTKLSRRILSPLAGVSNAASCLKNVLDALRQLLRPLQPVRLTKMSQNFRGHLG